MATLPEDEQVGTEAGAEVEAGAGTEEAEEIERLERRVERVVEEGGEEEEEEEEQSTEQISRVESTENVSSRSRSGSRSSSSNSSEENRENGTIGMVSRKEIAERERMDINTIQEYMTQILDSYCGEDEMIYSFPPLLITSIIHMASDPSDLLQAELAIQLFNDLLLANVIKITDDTKKCEWLKICWIILQYDTNYGYGGMCWDTDIHAELLQYSCNGRAAHFDSSKSRDVVCAVSYPHPFQPVADRRFFYTNIYVEQKSDEMWIGIGFEDRFYEDSGMYGWDIRRNANIVCYYGGRERSHLRDMVTEFPGKNEKDIRKEDIAKVTEGESAEEYWDGGYGMIQACNKILSGLLEWYRAGDCISLLMDLETSVLRFFKNDRFQAKVVLKEVIPEYPRKYFYVFGAVDDYNDVLIYDRQSWPNNKDPELLEQV